MPFSLTWRVLMLGTAEIGIVTLAKAVVPGRPVAVKLIEVDEPDILEIVASLSMEPEHPVPQLKGDADDTLNVTVAG